MGAEIWVAIITTAGAVVVAVLGAIYSNKQTRKEIKAQSDLTLYRIGELETKQDKYNHLQERVAKMEIHDASVDAKITDMRDDIKEIKRIVSSQK